MNNQSEGRIGRFFPRFHLFYTILLTSMLKKGKIRKKNVNSQQTFGSMRYWSTWILLVLVLFSSCKKKTFTLEGQLNALSTDTLLVYYIEPSFSLDTIILKNGKFKYKIQPDTLTVFQILWHNQEMIPIFADKGQKVKIKGDNHTITIKGRDENKLMNEILTALNQSKEKDTKAFVDSIIREHPRSFTNLYLLDKYYVRDSVIDINRLKALIGRLSGNIQDTRYVSNLKKRLDQATMKNNSYINIFNMPDRNGKTVGLAQMRDKYILLSFWASWNPESIAYQDTLASAVKALKKEKFVAMSISLDMNKEAWLNAISNRDTTQWLQACDFKAWQGNIITQTGLVDIPKNYLLDKNRRVLIEDINGDSLVHKVKDLIKQDQEKEKEQKQRRLKK